ncbi:L-glyceraldehyde 3-phosphate reductase [Pontiella desulfatans]|uniref:L-glyceraldehyde 3-phosphate reductase n=1 Tax=Pontiella desulfatans TaxID=2750659 RepID=A0A6C2UE00_PONDE|nr:aldo/keto reductase [Pontiella desulfatans]VGO17767.1 L-glyceraldehyde 3-phosphate reductase [Pontiella desulfatans]
MNYSETRNETMLYNRVGRSGLKLPAISLGMWHNFGEGENLANQAALLRTAFDAGITHFDLADNYGGGFAEVNVGNMLKSDFEGHRDELVISTKAGHRMWSGPYGDWGSRKHIMAGIDQSLERLQLDYVDIFYHHRPDPETPMEETAQALADVVRQGKALYVGISNYYGAPSRRMVALLKEFGAPCLLNQLPFNMFDRNAAESGEFQGLVEDGVGAITFSPLAQGLLSARYLHGVPADSRAATEGTCLDRERVSDELLEKVRALNEIARQRGQSLAQMALCWNLDFAPVASVLIGASRPEQLVENTKALENRTFSGEERSLIDSLTAA